jgi:hypothetical protein
MNADTLLESRSAQVRWWPIAVFIGCLLVFNLTFLLVGSWIGLPSFQRVMFGLILGQGVFASIVAGLGGQSWLKGLLLATGFVALIVGLVVFEQIMIFILQLRMNITFVSGAGTEIVWGLFFLPLVCLVTSIAGLTMRIVRGWCLTAAPMDYTPRQPIRLIDFFFVMTTLACLFGMFRIPLILWNSNQNNTVGGLAYVAVVFSLCNLVIGIPCTYVAFRARRPFHGFLCSLGVSLVAPGVICIIIGLGTGSVPMYLRIALSTGGILGLTVSLGLWSLRCSGIRLLHYPTKTALAATTEPESDGTDSIARPRRSAHFVWTAWFASFAIVCSLSTSFLVSWRESTEKRTAQLQQELSATNSTMSIRDWRAVELNLGPSAPTKTLESFPYSSQIESLSIAHTNLSNTVIDSIDKFGSLKSLDLSYSDLDEDGLKRLAKSSRWPKLKRLSIAGTKITPQMFTLLPRIGAPPFVDLSDLGVTDNDLTLSAFRYESIRLAKNQITDSGIRKLFSGSNSYYRRLLDLSDNPIDGSGFTVPCTFSRLVLDGNPLTDGTFGPQLKNVTVHDYLVLRNTQLTDNFLLTLAATTTISGIELGDGNFTEKGLSNLAPRGIGKLSLTGKQFTGECFKTWSPSVNVLSMRGSSLNDETIGYVATLGTVYDLDLSKTAITDAGLASFPAISVLTYLNLSDTQVTVKGLMDSKLPTFCNIQLAPGQFTSDAIKMLKTRWKIVLADKPRGVD